MQQTRKGQELVKEKETMNLALTPQNYQKILQAGLLPGKDLKIDPNTQAVRIVVVDRANGATGSVTIPVTAQDKSSASLTPAPLSREPEKSPN